MTTHNIRYCEDNVEYIISKFTAFFKLGKKGLKVLYDDHPQLFQFKNQIAKVKENFARPDAYKHYDIFLESSTPSEDGYKSCLLIREDTSPESGETYFVIQVFDDSGKDREHTGNKVPKSLHSLLRSLTNSGVLDNQKYRENVISKIMFGLGYITRNPDGWMVLKEHMFRAIIDVLSKHNALDLHDDHLVIENTGGYFFHALRGFWGSHAEKFQKLVGCYHFYTPSAIEENKIVLGWTSITYDEMSNALKSFSIMKYSPDKMETREYYYHGTIVPIEKKRCLQIDRDGNIDRINLLEEVHTNEKTNHVASLEGWTNLTYEHNRYIRRIFLERCDKCQPDQPPCIKPDYYPYNHGYVPESLQPYLKTSGNKFIRDTINILHLRARGPEHFSSED